MQTNPSSSVFVRFVRSLLLLLLPALPTHAGLTNMPSPNRLAIMVNSTNYTVVAPTNTIIGKWAGDGSALSNLTVTATATNMSAWSSSPATQTVNLADNALTNVIDIYQSTASPFQLRSFDGTLMYEVDELIHTGYGTLTWPGNLGPWDLDLYAKFDVSVDPGFIHLKTAGSHIKLESGSDIYFDTAAGRRIYCSDPLEVQTTLYARSLRIIDPSTNAYCTITTTNITFGTNTVVIDFANEKISATAGVISNFTYYGNGAGLTNIPVASVPAAARTNETRACNWESATVAVADTTFQHNGTNVILWKVGQYGPGTNWIYFTWTNGNSYGWIMP